MCVCVQAHWWADTWRAYSEDPPRTALPYGACLPAGPLMDLHYAATWRVAVCVCVWRWVRACLSAVLTCSFEWVIIACSVAGPRHASLSTGVELERKEKQTCVCVSLVSFVLADNTKVNFNNPTLHDLKKEELSQSELKRCMLAWLQRSSNPVFSRWFILLQ